MEVKLLIYTTPFELERQIKKWVNEFGYSLHGAVTMGLNQNGNVTYVATMVKEEKQ